MKEKQQEIKVRKYGNCKILYMGKHDDGTKLRV